MYDRSVSLACSLLLAGFSITTGAQSAYATSNAPIVISTTATKVYGQSGSFSTTGTAFTADRLNYPLGIRVDSSGGLYIAVTNNNRVLYYASGSSTPSRAYGSIDVATKGVSTPSQTTFSPRDIALDSRGGLYVADAGNNRVLYFAAGETTAAVV